MIKQLSAFALSKVFGDGLSADLAERGIRYLANETRAAIARDDVNVTSVRLQAGESYSVIARPPAKRRERKLAASKESLRERYSKASRPTRRQIVAARKLAKTQKKLDKERLGGRKYRRLAGKERVRGINFDKVNRPSKRQEQLGRQLEAVTLELDRERAENFEAARAKLSRKARRSSSRLY